MLTNEEKVLKVMCEKDLLFFTRYIYKENHRRNFIVAPHFVIIANKLMDVINGKTKRLIINIPPRYGKTELAVKSFICYGLAINPQSKFIHLSYSFASMLKLVCLISCGAFPNKCSPINN